MKKSRMERTPVRVSLTLRKSVEGVGVVLSSPCASCTLVAGGWCRRRRRRDLECLTEQEHGVEHWRGAAVVAEHRCRRGQPQETQDRSAAAAAAQRSETSTRGAGNGAD
jgi:hypothetical protein